MRAPGTVGLGAIWVADVIIAVMPALVAGIHEPYGKTIIRESGGGIRGAQLLSAGVVR
jgi:hypothetical protein